MSIPPWRGRERRTGAWDEFTQLQFPAFEGWNAIALNLLKDDNPANDITPEAAQHVFSMQLKLTTDPITVHENSGDL